MVSPNHHHHHQQHSVGGGEHQSGGGVPLYPVIGYVEPNSVAERCGILQPGDRILSVNKHSLEALSLEDARQIIKDAGATLNLEIEFDVAGSSPSQHYFTYHLLIYKLYYKLVSFRYHYSLEWYVSGQAFEEEPRPRHLRCM